MSLRAVADIFTRYGVKTVSGRGQWLLSSVVEDWNSNLHFSQLYCWWMRALI